MSENCKKIKRFLKNIDLFKLTFSFKYKSKEEYSTTLGAFFCFIFYIASLSIFVIKYIPYKKKIILVTILFSKFKQNRLKLRLR